MFPQVILSVALGMGLSAACGFRVFVPLLVMSAAALSGHLTLAAGFEWIGSYPALAVLAVATVLEVLAYYFPLVDNMLDLVATPAAVVAGVVATAASVGDVSPLLHWSLALIMGGGSAAVVQGTTVKARLASAALTGGTLNPAVSTAENGGALGLSLLCVVLPVLALAAALLVVLGLFVYARRTPEAPKTPGPE